MFSVIFSCMKCTVASVLAQWFLAPLVNTWGVYKPPDAWAPCRLHFVGVVSARPCKSEVPLGSCVQLVLSTSCIWNWWF